MRAGPPGYAEHSALLAGQRAYGRAIAQVPSPEAGEGSHGDVEVLDLRRSQTWRFPRADSSEQTGGGLGRERDRVVADVAVGRRGEGRCIAECSRHDGGTTGYRLRNSAGQVVMGRRHPNYRLVKTHRNYTVDEAATVLHVHRNTVSNWTKHGLKIIDSQRPRLIHGGDLSAFLLARRVAARRPCGPGQMYCLRCRIPVNPAGDMADFQPTTATLGNLIGICPKCDTLIYRKVNCARLAEIRGRLDIWFSGAGRHISQCDAPFLNRAFKEDAKDHVELQP